MTFENDDPVLTFYFHVFLRCHPCSHLQGVPRDRSTVCAVCGKENAPNAFQVVPVDPSGMPFKLAQVLKWKEGPRELLVNMSPKLERWELDPNLYVIRWVDGDLSKVFSNLSISFRRSELMQIAEVANPGNF